MQSPPDWIDRREYPFEAHWFRVPAGRMHYVDEGHGSPVIMVHGNPTWSFLYRRLIEALCPKHRCIAHDHLGFGLSDKPADWTYRPQGHAGNLTALIEGLGLQDVTLILHDWGGPIGLSYAVDHPENVSRIILVNTWAWPVNRELRLAAFSYVMGGPIGRMLIRRYNFFACVLLPQAAGDRGSLSKAVHAHYLHPLSTPQDRRGCLVFPGEIVGSTPWLRRLWRQLPVLREKPKLLVWGMEDPAFGAGALRRWQNTFPDARAVRLHGVGHLVPEEAADALGSAVSSFLAATA